MTRQTRESRALPVPSSRISRFSKLGSMTAGVAGNMALQGLGELGRGRKPAFRDLLLTPQNVSRITERLAEMRGAAMKIGQLVSMDTGEVLPPELALIMARLRDDAHYMPPAQLKKVFNQHWPQGWIRQFKFFDVRPIAAASIGQVHRGLLKDGRSLAVKVQYPGVAVSIDSDVANVGALIRMSGLLPKGFDLAPYLEEARQQLHDETDYLKEGGFLSAFHEVLSQDDRFILPELCEDWTTRNILSMTFLEGQPIEEAEVLPQPTRNEIATALIELVLKELFEFGLMQTDPNYANYRYDSETEKIVLLDFGATRILSPEIAENYRALMTAGLREDRDGMREHSLRIGFFAADTEERHQQTILDMMSLVFAEMNRASAYDFASTELSLRLQREGMKLAEQGFIPPPLPIDVLFVQRKFGGVFLLASKLKARVHLQELFTTYLQTKPESRHPPQQ